MKTLQNNKKMLLGGLLTLALLPLLGAFISRAQPATKQTAVLQVADGTETHGSKPPKGA